MMGWRIGLRWAFAPVALAVIAVFALAPVRTAEPWLLDRDPRLSPQLLYEAQADARFTLADAAATAAGVLARVRTLNDEASPTASRSTGTLSRAPGAFATDAVLSRVRARFASLTGLAIACALTPVLALWLLSRSISDNPRPGPLLPAFATCAALYASATLVSAGAPAAWDPAWGRLALWALIGLLGLHAGAYFVVLGVSRANAHVRPSGRGHR